MLVQANVEDASLGVPDYAVEKLGVEGIEIKWGQGAKSIGGEVKCILSAPLRELGGGKEYQGALLRTFAAAPQLKEKYGDDFARIPPAAIATYTYYDRLATGLRQLMAGARKFALNFLSRGDLMSLTQEAAEVSGIPHVMQADMEEVERILG